MPAHVSRKYHRRSSRGGVLTKNGAGTLILTGSNSYTGGTTISRGTLAINSDAALGAAGSSITIGSDKTNYAGTLKLLADFTADQFSLSVNASNDLVLSYVAGGVEPPYPGDANGDDFVDYNDLLILSRNYGQGGKLWGDGDFTADGLVDYNDLLLLSRNYNTGPTGEAAAPQLVPEPSSLALLALRRKRQA